MRIGVNCWHVQPHTGGVKQYFLALFNQLLPTDDQNDYVFFVSRQVIPELSELASDRWRDQAVQLDSQGQIRNYVGGLDLYFSPINGLQPLPLPPVPTVITMHDIQDRFHPSFFGRDELFYRDWYYVVSSQVADRIIAVSQFSRQTVAAEYHVSPNKITVAYTCPDERYRRAEQVGRPPDYALPEAYLLYPANRWRHKNHATLLGALRLLRDEHGLSIPLVCTGRDVPGAPGLRELAERHGVSNLVHDLGYLDVTEMAYLYRHARALIFPSLFEGFGIPLVEAMAAGCPLAVASCTSLPEIAGPAAHYFDPQAAPDIADAIRALWLDPDLRQRLIEEGYRRLPLFSAQQMAQRHLEAFAQAAHSFSWRRYVGNLLLRLPYHLLRVLVKRAGGVYARQSGLSVKIV